MRALKTDAVLQQPGDRTKKALKTLARYWLDAVVLVVVGVVFVVPFIFIFLTAAKPPAEASLFQFSWPTEFQLLKNIQDVLAFGDNRMYRAFWNSTLLTVGSVTLIVFFSAFAAFVMQRRNDRTASVASTIALSGLIIPPAVVPTIFLLQRLGIYKTMLGLICVEVAFGIPFAILVFRAFMGAIPRDIDEAAIVDGASPLQVFFRIILPLLKPAMITVIVISSVIIYNDFTLPLYFLPGAENVTVQITLYGFVSQFLSQWNLLFADVFIITIPPLIMFFFFQRQIVSGMTVGAVRG
jgi:raffinose/stachyose/melibiose transport system permease protein